MTYCSAIGFAPQPLHVHALCQHLRERPRQPEPEPDLSPEPEPASEPLSLSPVPASGFSPPPAPAPASPATPAKGAAADFRTCLDREFVQKEVGWCQQYHKPIITVFEDERRRQAYFDYSKAWAKYGGTEWEFILVSRAAF